MKASRPLRAAGAVAGRAALAARVAGAGAFVVVASCGHPEPSRTPLSVSTRTDARTLPSSSRAVEPSDEDEERQELEIVVQPSDDGDDSTKARSTRSSGGQRVASPSSAKTTATASQTPAAVCVASAGPAPDCAALAPASSCLGASIAQRACERLGPALDPRVGAAWMTCMRDPESGSACDSHRVVDCGLRAVGTACVDGAYHALCADIAASCSDVAEQITAPVCERLIGAWKPERRSQIIECLRHGCETGGFGICLP
jgi:hypothetical protein